MIQRRIFVLFLAILFAVPMLSTSAQTPVADGTSPVDITASPGLQDAVWRSYGGPNAFISGQESVDGATPWAVVDPNKPMVGFVDVLVLEFDTVENATYGYALQIYTIIQSSILFGGNEAMAVTHESLTMDGTDHASVTRQQMDGANGTMAYDYVVFQRGQYLVMVSSSASTFDGSSNVPAWEAEFPNLEIASDMALTSQPSTDEVVFADDGTSTGGLWGMMPGTDSGIMQEMQMRPLQDGVIFPMPTP